MEKFTLSIAATVLQLSVVYSQSSEKEFPVLKGAYWGQKPYVSVMNLRLKISGFQP